jgi:hypothetical protein
MSRTDVDRFCFFCVPELCRWPPLRRAAARRGVSWDKRYANKSFGTCSDMMAATAGNPLPVSARPRPATPSPVKAVITEGQRIGRSQMKLALPAATRSALKRDASAAMVGEISMPTRANPTI